MAELTMSHEEVAGLLQEIYEVEGELTPERLVEVAKPVSHPLHGYFTWNDKDAAQKHRVEEARKLIRSVKVILVPNEEAEEMRVRAWQAVRRAGRDGRGYMPESEVREDPVARAFLLRTMRREFIAMRRRYQHLNEFWSMLDEMERPEGNGAQAEAAEAAVS